MLTDRISLRVPKHLKKRIKRLTKGMRKSVGYDASLSNSAVVRRLLATALPTWEGT